jgi:hypothetical protein
MKNSSCLSFLAFALVVGFGCSSSSGGTTPAPTDTGSGSDTADTAVATDTATPDSPADTTSADTGPADTGSDAPFTPSAAAKYFCDGYKSACGFGKTGYFADYDTCEREYDSYPSDKELCVGNALGAGNCAGAACTAAPCTPCK